VYLGAAYSSYSFAKAHLSNTLFADTGEPIGTAPFQQQLLGEMTEAFETARLWMARQIELETAEPPIMDKADVVRQWRVAKGSVAEAAFTVGTKAFTACGTSNTGNSGVISRMLRDLSMGLVQAFPAEKGRMEAATTIVRGVESTQFGAAAKPQSGTGSASPKPKS